MQTYRWLNKEECRIDDFFWNRYIELVKDKVIPCQWESLNDFLPDAEPSHALDNFRIAAKQKDGHFYGEVFQDSDVYKWLEAVGNILLLQTDKELEDKADEIIELIGMAQEPDGYLNTYFTIEEPDQKWTNVLECHELYCAGHFIEGAIAYYRATKKQPVLDIAVKLADHIDLVFGAEEHKLHGYPGHQEIEIALLKLYELSGIKRYLNLAKYFIDTRGTNDFFEQEFEKRNRICFWNKAKEKAPNRRYNQFSYKNYNQFHQPVREQKEASGHAVRAVYMYTAMAELAARTQDEGLLDACKSLWQDIVRRQMYITGGIGATPSGEAFTIAYDLPNDTNYSETCASIALIFFAGRMLLADVDRTYGDTIEQALYNTVLGGMNYEGNRFFYVNPLAVVPETCRGNTERNHIKPIRQKWFACACCPPNIARTIPDLWRYVYTASGHTVYNHLYIGGKAEIALGDGTVSIEQTTEYPWGNRVKYKIRSNHEELITFAVRIPGWATSFRLIIDGREAVSEVREDGYIYIERSFAAAVDIELILQMEPMLVSSNPNVHYNIGRAAIVRGPLVYCIEEADNQKYLNRIQIDPKAPLREVISSNWKGAVEIEGSGCQELTVDHEQLYRAADIRKEPVTFRAVPYFLWNNRGGGEMQVWVRTL